MEAILDQVDFVIDALSKSTNPRHAEERADTLTQLRATREIAVLTPNPEPRELEPGEIRMRFANKAAWLAELRTHTLETLWPHFTIWMDVTGEIVVDVMPEAR